jgi:heme a synthase
MDTVKQQRIIGNWLLLGVAMLVIQVVLGGVTRLTGSGLSITEWEPLMGALPPLTETAWQKAFEGYKQIAQFKYLNSAFELGDFKMIFFWEWFHRLWARLMGVVFLLPFLYFLLKGYFKKWMIMPLIMLFVLGGMQGLIGWIMVKSGLNDENLYVSHYRLAIHFMAAMLLIGYTLVFALSVKIPPSAKIKNSSLKKYAVAITALVCVQLVYGCFMAGLKAANIAPTWPSINGSIISNPLFKDGFTESILHNTITIHFIHRTLAYLLFILVIAWWVKARKESSSALFNKARNYPFILVLLQVVLGIATVLSSSTMVAGHFGVFEWLAELHQLTGMLLLLSFIAVIYILTPSAEG